MDGKVESGAIVTNWKTRSRGTYDVLGKEKAAIASNEGKHVIARGTICETTLWSGTIEVQSFKVVPLR